MIHVGLVGPGHAGRAIVTLLPRDQYNLGPVVGTSLTSARRAVREMEIGAPSDSFASLSSCDLVLVAVSDSAIESVARHLASVPDAVSEKVILLVSALRSSRNLAVLQQQTGADTGSFCPLFVILGPVLSFAGVHFIVEGTPRAAAAARRLVRALGGEFQLVEPDRKAHHAAAVSLASEVLAGLLESAVGGFVAGGLPRKRALEALKPIVRLMLEEHARSGPKVRPGPLLKDDSAAVAERLAALRAVNGATVGHYLGWARQALLALNKSLEVLDAVPERAASDTARGRSAAAGAGQAENSS